MQIRIKLVQVGKNFAASDISKHLDLQELCECLCAFLSRHFRLSSSVIFSSQSILNIWDLSEGEGVVHKVKRYLLSQRQFCPCLWVMLQPLARCQILPKWRRFNIYLENINPDYCFLSSAWSCLS